MWENLLNTILNSLKLENMGKVAISISKNTRSSDLTGKVTVLLPNFEKSQLFS